MVAPNIKSSIIHGLFCRLCDLKDKRQHIMRGFCGTDIPVCRACLSREKTGRTFLSVSCLSREQTAPEQ
jgi:hypothetical protein